MEQEQGVTPPLAEVCPSLRRDRRTACCSLNNNRLNKTCVVEWWSTPTYKWAGVCLRLRTCTCLTELLLEDLTYFWPHGALHLCTSHTQTHSLGLFVDV